MLMIERKIGGLLSYRKVYFPTPEAAHEITRSLRPNEIVRLFGVFSDLGTPPFLIKHEQILTTWVDLSAGPEGILRGMKKKSCRYEIRRAEKMLHQVEIEINSTKALSDFLSLYDNFATRNASVPRLPTSQLQEYLLHGEVVVLYQNGRQLCGHLLFCDPGSGIVKLLFSASRRLESKEDAAACGALNRYLHWSEMVRYASSGYLTYDFGGVRSETDPVSRFKLSFGGPVVTEHYYLFGGNPWVARLGNIVYSRLLKPSEIMRRIISTLTTDGSRPDPVGESPFRLL